MIYPDASGVQSSRIAISSHKLRQVSRHDGKVGNRIRIKEWLYHIRDQLPCLDGRNCRYRSRRLAQPKPFEREEKERPVPYNRPTDNTTKIILPFLCSCQAAAVGEPVVCVQDIVPQVVEQRTVKIICARAGEELYLPAGRPAELWRKTGSLNLEFLQSVNGDQTVGSTERSKAGKRSGP